MRSLSDTISQLASPHRKFAADSFGTTSRLTRIADFGSNPGALTGHIYVPENLTAGAALVVVLHGCTQNAAGYDFGSGWSEMADRHGFALLYPEQQRENNPNRCFNWFLPTDTRRGSGEAFSIRQMIAAVVADHPIDAARVFVTGLSAGGAMAAVMLATYPEVFAGGAIIAGLPYGCASNLPQALQLMRGQGIPDTGELVSRFRAASSHSGPWPTLSVWHGSADSTVQPANARAIVAAWCEIHGVPAKPSVTEEIDGSSRRVWRKGDGRDVIEAYTIKGMEHGTPLDSSNPEGCGRAGAFMIDVGISSTQRICEFWGLPSRNKIITLSELDVDLSAHHPIDAAPMLVISEHDRNDALWFTPQHWKGETARGANVRKIIENALRSAGLME
ncbi:poly(hydroxyalkanoate) depolymerase family esterase [Novosphingobium sp. PhB165]|uniref:extracellular catalytic domain type 1 short-chain-length polyhydroxyalkanoate depolymerase n=1 Tax=Novosphingobium sp. PhB165 TaxID=2485105 RepID=UPI001052B389|nr:PHB depolymerase family esterase [Novosphingobium sp. PhB165]TCM13043.1 poly(hydroxyalkanoate) depolymerase family esterase [Novosphingobium sp. PhB165]